MRLLQLTLPGLDSGFLYPALDRGLMPHLATVVERGSTGALYAPHPLCSDPVCSTLYSGVGPDVHGVRAARAPGGRSWYAHDLQVPALWHRLDAHALRSLTVGCAATFGGVLHHGLQLPALFGAPGFLPVRPNLEACLPAGRQPAGFREAWLSGPELPADLLRWFLGDNALDLTGHEAVLVDAVAAACAHTLSLHTAALLLAAQHRPDAMWVEYPLIEALSPLLARLPASTDENPAPQAVNAALQLFDRLLGALLELLDPEGYACVCSGHGQWLHSPRLREAGKQGASTVFARRHGWFALAGPGVPADALAHGVACQDLCPSLLALLGMETPTGLHGRVHPELFPPPGPAAADNASTAPPAMRFDPAQPEPVSNSRIAVLAMAALDGYGTGDPEPCATDEADLQLRWQSIQAELDGVDPRQALEPLRALCNEYPDRLQFVVALVMLQLELGLTEDALSEATAVREDFPQLPLAQVLWARCALDGGQREAARETLREAEALTPGSEWEALVVSAALAQLYGELDDPAADSHAERLVELAPGHAQAWRVRAVHQLRRRESVEAAGSVRELLRLDPHSAEGHALLANTLLAQGRLHEALPVLETCLRMPLDRAPVLRALVAVHQALEHPRWQWAQHARALEALPPAPGGAERTPQTGGGRVTADGPSDAEADVALALEQMADWRNVAQQGLDFAVLTGWDRGLLAREARRLADGGMAVLGSAPDCFEDPRLRGLAQNPRLLEAFPGHLLVIPPRLLPAMPAIHRYRIAWLGPVAPPAGQVRQSHCALSRRGLADVDETDLTALLRQRAEGIAAALARRPRVSVQHFPELAGPAGGPLAGWLAAAAGAPA